MRLPFLGLDFDALAPADAVAAIVRRARAQAAFAYVATPNVDHMVRLDREPNLHPLYRDAWLTLCDSRILELLASASGLRLPASPGADLVEALFRDHVGADEPVVIIGGDLALMRALRTDFALADLRWFDAPPNLRNDSQARKACADFILANPAPFIFLAVGSPQQELIAHEVMQRGGATGVAICCGASLEFLTGKVQRAPKWMRAARLEWLHRLASEPARLWRRYIIEGPRILGIWLAWRAQVAATAPTAGLHRAGR